MDDQEEAQRQERERESESEKEKRRQAGQAPLRCSSLVKHLDHAETSSDTLDMQQEPTYASQAIEKKVL
jgi:hypothetical protein